MKRIVLNIDHDATFEHCNGKVPPVLRFVVRTDKICGCQEMLDHSVKVTIDQGESRPIMSVVVLESFEQVASAMME